MEPIVWDMFEKETTPQQTTKKREWVRIVEPTYAVFEIEPSALSDNNKVRWMFSDFARIYRDIFQRVNVGIRNGIEYKKELTIWWEVVYTKKSIKFYFKLPNNDKVQCEGLANVIRNCWKQSTVKEVQSAYTPFDLAQTSLTRFTLRYNSILSLNTHATQFSFVEQMLNTKTQLGEHDRVVFQIGLQPYGEAWRDFAHSQLEALRKDKNKLIKRKKSPYTNMVDHLTTVAWAAGVVAEEAMNLVCDVFIPGYEESREVFYSNRDPVGDIKESTTTKAKSDAFYTAIRVAVESPDTQRRLSILRTLSAGFDPLAGNNELIEYTLNDKQKQNEIIEMENHQFPKTTDVLCSHELAQLIQIPDRMLQREHAAELAVAKNRSAVPIPKQVFNDGIPFATYADVDGVTKTVNYDTKNYDQFCLSRIFIGATRGGKTTAGINFLLGAFEKGYGGVYVDAADGEAMQRILNHIKPEDRGRVHVLDFTTPNFSFGLTLCEAFNGGDLEDVEDIIAEEIIYFIESVSGEPLNMTAKTWVSIAAKAVFTSPTATLGDVVRVIRDAAYREAIISTTNDISVKKQLTRFHNLNEKEQAKIYNQAFHRLYEVVTRKKLRRIFLQPPKCGDDNMPLINFRRWFDKGDLTLIRVSEFSGEKNTTAIMTFLLAKINLAVISREDIPVAKRRPCFIELDEPDHYIKGSERWRNMFTRYGKYRAGLVFLFHKFEQLAKTDKKLPEIIMGSDPHYLIFQTEQKTLELLRHVFDNEFSVEDVLHMPKYHAVVKVKAFDENNNVVPTFIAKTLEPPEMRLKQYDNNDLTLLCGEQLGRTKQEVDQLLIEFDTDEFDGGIFDEPLYDAEVETNSGAGSGLLREVDES